MCATRAGLSEMDASFQALLVRGSEERQRGIDETPLFVTALGRAGGGDPAPKDET